MTDITLTDLTSLANDTSATNSINNNFQTVEDVINDEIVHTTGGNNVMSQDLDMNSNDVLNVNTLNGFNMADFGTIPTYVADAAASAAAAATSETNAATSETNAATSASEAAASASSIDINLDQQNVWTAGQVGEVTTLTDAANIAIDLADSNNFTVTLAGNRTLDNPSNAVAGQSGFIEVIQDGTGNRTLALGSNYKTVGGAGITLSTDANAEDTLEYRVRSATKIDIVKNGAWS